MTPRQPCPTPRCCVCEQPIRGTYHTNLWGRPFHTHHQTCSSCLRPIRSRATRGLCRHCQPMIITSPTAAASVVETTRESLHEYRGLTVSAGLPVRLVDNLGGGSGLLGQAQMHQTRHQDGRRTGTATIVLRRGLPAPQLAAVAAHELSHVWLWAHDIKTTTVVDEGLAELCAYWTLGRLGGPIAAALQHRIAANPDPTYGGGYRRARAAEDRHGWTRDRAHLLTRSRLP